MELIRLFKNEEQKPEEKNEREYITPAPVAPVKKKPEGFACEFFNVSIYDIAQHNPELVEKGIDAHGHATEIYSLNLAEPEMALFHHVDVRKYANGNYDLRFTSQRNELTEEVSDFVDFCIEALGPDFMRKTNICNDDVRDMRLGVFSRIWAGRVRIENIDFTLSLTLYNIEPKQY
jgi:hypothetical protein